MKIQATVELSVKAASLQEAGAALDDIVAAMAERHGVAVDRVELGTPSPRERVTLPPVVVRAPERHDAPWMAAT